MRMLQCRVARRRRLFRPFVFSAKLCVVFT
jgi:hypothetical protein